jgi:hypothetical protein
MAITKPRGYAEIDLAEATNGTAIKMWMGYDPGSRIKPEVLALEKDLLAPMFEASAQPFFYIQTGRLDVQLRTFEEAIMRFLRLASNWGSEIKYRHSIVRTWMDRNPEVVDQLKGLKICSG